MPRRKKPADETSSLLDITSKLRSGPCVPPLREAVKSWKASNYKGITDTTRSFPNPSAFVDRASQGSATYTCSFAFNDLTHIIPHRTAKPQICTVRWDMDAPFPSAPIG
jgi:hypothetical protein